MSDPTFFGYGSLVNVATHDYPSGRKATLHGWRRVWRVTPEREEAFLSVRPHPGSAIDGLVSDVPHGDWAALDERETGYVRFNVEATLEDDDPMPTSIYQVTPAVPVIDPGHHVILLSYLDVVVEGYRDTFGHAGVKRFFDTTSGWHIPVLDDRAAPRYPRHRSLSDKDLQLVDSELERLSAQVQKPE